MNNSMVVLHTLTCAHVYMIGIITDHCSSVGEKACKDVIPNGWKTNWPMPGAFNSQSCSGKQRLGSSTVGCQLARRGRGTARHQYALNETCSLSSCRSVLLLHTHQNDTEGSKSHPSPTPLLCPYLVRRVLTLTPLNLLHITPRLTLIYPSSVLTSSLVIFSDFLVASHLFSFLSFCPPRGTCPPGW